MDQSDGLNGACSRQGGVSDEVTLSAYITAAFLEMGMSPTVSTKARAKESDRFRKRQKKQADLVTTKAPEGL